MATRGAEMWLAYRPFGDSAEVVQMVDEARLAVLRDTASRALEAGFSRVRVFSTVEIEGLSVERTAADAAIGEIVSSAAADSRSPVCYAGSGMPAMTPADWSELLSAVEACGAVSNRMFSCDWLAVLEGRLLSIVGQEVIDNRWAVLVRDSGIAVQQFPRSSRSLLDLDTPTDLAVLAACADAGSLEPGSCLQDVIARWQGLIGPSVEQARRVFDLMTRRDAELILAGRIGASDWAVVDRDTSCRVRVISEERGLRSRGAAARSVLGALYESLGRGKFVSQLAELGDGLIWDTRPCWSHLDWRLRRADRFWSDLGRWDAIAHPELRALTQALQESRQHVLSGGHSLVSGAGCWPAVDEAWTRRETRQEPVGELPD